MTSLSHLCGRHRPDRKRLHRSQIPTGLVGTIAATLILFGCSVPETGVERESTSPTLTPEIAALVPESIKQDGILEAATDPNYAPMEFPSEDGTTVQGVDIDLTEGVAEVLGLVPRFRREAYTAIPDGVRNGRFEIGVASLTIRSERQLRTNAVLYFESGTQLVRSQQAQSLNTESMCGHKIASLEGSVQVAELTRESRSCRDRGYSDIEIMGESAQESVTRAVVSGRADGLLADTPVANLAVNKNPTSLELAGASYDKAPLGMLTSRELSGFTKAVRNAVQVLIDSGYYAQVLRDWNVTGGEVDTARIRWSTGRA